MTKKIWTTKVVGGGETLVNQPKRKPLFYVSSLRVSNKNSPFLAEGGLTTTPPLIWDMSPKKFSLFFDNLPKEEGREGSPKIGDMAPTYYIDDFFVIMPSLK